MLLQLLQSRLREMFPAEDLSPYLTALMHFKPNHQNHNETMENLFKLAEEIDKVLSHPDGKTLFDIIQEFERAILEKLPTTEKMEPKKINPKHYADIQKSLGIKIVKTVEINTRHHQLFWSRRVYGITEADIRYDKWRALQNPNQADQLQVQAEYIKITLSKKESLRETARHNATQKCLERKKTFSLLFNKPNSLVSSLPGEVVKEIVSYINH